MRYCLR